MSDAAMKAAAMKVHVAAHVLWWLRLRRSLSMADDCGWCWRHLRSEVTR